MAAKGFKRCSSPTFFIEAFLAQGWRDSKAFESKLLISMF